MPKETKVIKMGENVVMKDRNDTISREYHQKYQRANDKYQNMIDRNIRFNIPDIIFVF